MIIYCSRCLTPYSFTEKEVNLLLASGILFVDCLNCGSEMPLEHDA